MFDIWRQEGHPANSEVKFYFQSFVLLHQNPHHHVACNMEYKNNIKIRLGTLNIGALNEMGLEICDELWKRNVDLCCSLVVRWRGCGVD